MALGTAFINLFIPIEIIEKKYPGGFKKYKLDSECFFEQDDYLIKKGAMPLYERSIF